MAVATRPLFAFDDSYARELDDLSVPWEGAVAEAPKLTVLNEELVAELGADPDALREPAGLAVLTGSASVDGSTPVAMAYAGHQFGSYAPLLGDGRALLLGEVVDRRGKRRDLHLKGSGPTPFARGGDGRAALGPMLRELLVGEAMHALGIPTTRGLAVVETGEQVARDRLLPGAVLARVAASHVRVGTFQLAASRPDPTLVRRLADHVIARHHPEARDADHPYLALYEAVVDAQASLIARWMLVGFVHGVMNTDNMTISGESIDYGPCAFIDAYDPAAVFSSIDLGGRYAFGNQPRIAQWNLARLAEALLSIIDPDTDAAVAAAEPVLRSFGDRFERYWLEGMRAKLGLEGQRDEDRALAQDLFALMQGQGVDLTGCFRALSGAVRGDPDGARAHFADPEPYDAWSARWQARRRDGGSDPDVTAATMDRANPIYIPRNHLVEAALDAATDGDLEPFTALLEAVSRPYDERPGLEAFAEPAPASFGPYRTYCGT